MSSFTVQIFFVESNHKTDKLKYHSLDIIGFHERITDKPNTTGRLALIHVDNAPNPEGLANIIKECARTELDLMGGLAKRSAWSISLTTEQQQELTDKREIIILWKDLKSQLTRKWDAKDFGSFHAGIE